MSRFVSRLVSRFVSLCLITPVPGPVIEPFVAPACSFCPGNRAIDFATRDVEPVRAPIAGVVHFVGMVGGRGYVTVRTELDLVTVGGLDSFESGVIRGRTVRQGQVLGVARGPEDPVTLSRRAVTDAEVYLDPTPLLGRLVGAGPRSRLVPGDGTRRRPGPRAVCRLGG